MHLKLTKLNPPNNIICIKQVILLKKSIRSFNEFSTYIIQNRYYIYEF